MVSAIFRRPHNSRFVVDELKSVFDPKGGGFWQGRYWNSTVAAIGRVIELHMIRIGYINQPEVPHELMKEPELAVTIPEKGLRGPSCPSCHSTNVRHEGGCVTCNDCGHSKCG
jgi:ribonucleoside-diphosphate reductase alpha chain